MGLIGGMARTAVVAGTATAVSNRVSRRQASRWQQQEYEQQAAYQQPVAAPPPPAPAAGTSDADTLSAELEKLGSLHRQGILSDEEFTAAKNKLLGI